MCICKFCLNWEFEKCTKDYSDPCPIFGHNYTVLSFHDDNVTVMIIKIMSPIGTSRVTYNGMISNRVAIHVSGTNLRFAPTESLKTRRTNYMTLYSSTRLQTVSRFPNIRLATLISRPATELSRRPVTNARVQSTRVTRKALTP